MQLAMPSCARRATAHRSARPRPADRSPTTVQWRAAQSSSSSETEPVTGTPESTGCNDMARRGGDTAGRCGFGTPAATKIIEPQDGASLASYLDAALLHAGTEGDLSPASRQQSAAALRAGGVTARIDTCDASVPQRAARDARHACRRLRPCQDRSEIAPQQQQDRCAAGCARGTGDSTAASAHDQHFDRYLRRRIGCRRRSGRRLVLTAGSSEPTIAAHRGHHLRGGDRPVRSLRR